MSREEEARNDDVAHVDDDPVYAHEITADASVIDANGHVNNVVYVRWMQDVAIEHFESVGGADLMRADGGTWVARSHHIEYLAPAFAGDRIEATTWIASLRRVRSLRRYAFTRVSDGKTLARGETDWVYVDTETGRPSSIPEAIKRAFTLAPDGPES